MNTSLNIAICEDLADDTALLLKCISQSKISTECKTFSSGQEFLAHFLPGQYDLIFLDIYMDGILGIDVAAAIRKEDDTVTLAFTTTSLDHTLEGYRLGVLKYLEKPVTSMDVNEALELALMKRSSAAYISLQTGGEKIALSLDSILYFEQRNQSVMVVTTAGLITTSQTVKLNMIQTMLPSSFIRCHYSYIVNLRYVKAVNQELKTFTMKNGDVVYIRRQDIKKATKAYEDCLFARARRTRASSGKNNTLPKGDRE